MGTGKGFKHICIYIYIYVFKFVVSFLKIHQLGGSDTLWGVEVAKKHISQLMVADCYILYRFIHMFYSFASILTSTINDVVGTQLT